MNEDIKYEELTEEINENSIEEKNVSKNVIEFFLGKNVIAKIAGVLIFLGIASFGQLAYEWMPDLGRVLLVFVIGLIFGVIGWWFERKDNEVFGSMFYSVSVLTLYLVLMLLKYQYHLIGDSFFTYSSVVFMIGVFIYFYDRRYSFLDTVLLVFYMVVGFITQPYFRWSGSISDYIEVSLLVLVSGYILFIYLTKYLSKKTIGKSIVVTILSIIFLCDLYVIRFEVRNIFEYFEVLYSLFVLFFVYIVNVYSAQKSTRSFKVITAFFTILILIFLAFNAFTYIDQYFNFEHLGYIPLYISILLTPIYVIYFLRKNEELKKINLIYLGVIVWNLYFFSTIAGAEDVRSDPYEFYILNIIVGSFLIFFFILSKITKDFYHKIASYIFMIIFGLNLFKKYFIEQKFSFDQMNIILVSLLIGIVVLGINLVFKYYFKQQDEFDDFAVQSLNILLLIPVIIMITKEWISIDLSIIGAMIIIGIIGYRWLMEISIFDMKYKKIFITGLNFKIVVLVLWISLIYFNHDFSLFSDVVKFIVVLSANIYIIQALRELYYGKTEIMDEEQTFVLLYLCGVVVHSYFIHRYINIEFDKVILSGYFMIASAIAILIGFKGNWITTRKIGLVAIYYSLGKFFIYDFYTQDFTTLVKMITYFVLGFILLGISFLYSYFEKEYGNKVIPL